MKLLLCISLLLILRYTYGYGSVHLLAENLEQLVTSTTLSWTSATSKTSPNYENVVIGAYETLGVSTEDNSIKKPIYICRARQNSIWVAGHLRPYDRKCLISVHGSAHESDRYELLTNIENSARLSWIRRDKYSTDPPGAVVGGEEPYKNFVARKPSESNPSLTHLLGNFDPSRKFGIFTFAENRKEVISDEGELLVETEPTKYEMIDVKYENLHKPQPREERILGTLVLKNTNTDGDTARVDTVISYNYTYKLYWGHGHGLLSGLPFEVHDEDVIHKNEWSIPEQNKVIKVENIEYFLAPGTAVNVTLKGVYVEADFPYSGTVISYYKDGEKRDRSIRDSKRESTMKNVTAEFGPVYFLHNNSFVPTTTTTTTTTTSTTTTTTRRTTIVTEPIVPPEIEETTKPKKTETSDPIKHENSSMMSDDGDALSLKKKESSASTAVINLFTFVAISIHLLRVT